MKKYDRNKKEWVSQEEYDKRMNQRDTKLCRGKKPHDFVLILPYGVEYQPTYEFNPHEYYKICDERYVYLESLKERFAAIGIKERFYTHKESRMYICSVCKKHKYQDE